MVFSSIIFIFYFLPIFLVTYFVVPRKLKNIVILAGSCFFYAWGAPKFIFVILGTTALDFVIVNAMSNADGYRKKLLLVISLSVNLGLLFYFKYTDFLLDNVNQLCTLIGAHPMSLLHLVLPIGISFYTFETITYVVDVYRGVHKPLRHFWDYQLYIIFFPKLIAGPIVRFHDIADQIYDRSAFENADHRLRGLYRFIIGLSKKVLIANIMGEAADIIMITPVDTVSTGYAWLGILFYTMQIYFDFSGYSDMALGLARLMGFRLPENFNNPYSALSITDFWRRWHISLGAWMRNYLYIPLGGNRVKSSVRLYMNLWFVFLASGLWHGAAWGYIIWGAYHGFFLVIERVGLSRWLVRLGRFSFLYTFPVVLVGWVFFKFEHWGASIAYLHRMFIFCNSGCTEISLITREHFIMLIFALIFSFVTVLPIGQRLCISVFESDYTDRKHLRLFFISLILLVFCTGRILTMGFNPFIYFRF